MQVQGQHPTLRAPSSRQQKGSAVYTEVWKKFRRHRLGMIGGFVVMVLLLVSLFSPFVAPYNVDTRHFKYVYAPPQKIHMLDTSGRLRRPFVYDLSVTVNENFQRVYVADTSKAYPVYFFVRGDSYKLFGLIPSDLHLFGTGKGNPFFPLGTEALGRDMVARLIYGGRISLSVGLFGVALSVILGSALGCISGYYGGRLDNLIQRLIEILKSVPTLPLWLALSAALPANWSSIKVYFGVVTILSLLGWADLGRQVRGIVLTLREQEYVLSAKSLGATTPRILFVHIFPNTLSLVIASATLAIPGTILGESALSFLGLGIRPPMTSWGVLLSQAQNLASLALYPWLLMPGLCIIITVLAFNFLGDGLRDAVDPYSTLSHEAETA